MPIEFYAACDGYNEKQDDKAMVIRFAAYRIAESMVGTKALGSIDKFWPINEKKSEQEVKNIQPMTRDQYDAIINRHKIKRK